MALTKISTDGVKDDAVTAGKIPANAVGSSELADNAVDTAAIADDAVTAAKLGAGSVDNTALANDSINGNKLQDNCVATSEIQDQAVTLAKLEHGTSSNDGKFLRANNGADPTFETVNTDLVADTSPQLGGNLDTNSHEIFLDDAHAVYFGNGNDFLVYHDGSHSYVQASGVGALKLVGNNSDDIQLQPRSGYNSLRCKPNAAVELYYDNSKKLETYTDGVKVTGVLRGTTSGFGIDFAETSNTSGMSSEVLDDYEEGTFTPNFLVGSSSAHSYSHRNGKYTKIGNIVHFKLRIAASSLASASNPTEIMIDGFPFTIANDMGGVSFEAGGIVYVFAGLASNGYGALQYTIDDTANGGSNAGNIRLWKIGDGGTSASYSVGNLNRGDVTNSLDIRITGTCHVS